jgi:hypothetical protein
MLPEEKGEYIYDPSALRLAPTGKEDASKRLLVDPSAGERIVLIRGRSGCTGLPRPQIPMLAFSPTPLQGKGASVTRD